MIRIINKEKWYNTFGGGIMAMVIRAHFDGTNIVPDEPVDLAVNEPLEFELKIIENRQERSNKQEEAWKRLKSRRISGLNIPDEALKRENLYEPPRGL